MSPGPTRADLLTADLRSRILAGELIPGAPLREETLVAETGYSRHTVRRALAALVTAQLAVAAPYRGISVATFDRRQVIELQQLRCALESEAVTLLIERHGHRWPGELLVEAGAAVDRLAASAGIDRRKAGTSVDRREDGTSGDRLAAGVPGPATERERATFAQPEGHRAAGATAEGTSLTSVSAGGRRPAGASETRDWTLVEQAHAEVHLSLVAAAGSLRLTDMYRRLTDEILLLLLHLRPHYGVAELVAEHRDYLEDVQTRGAHAVRGHLAHSTALLVGDDSA